MQLCVTLKSRENVPRKRLGIWDTAVSGTRDK